VNPIAKSIPSATSKKLPTPSGPSTLIGRIAQPNASPAMPASLFVASAIVEATCVPWPSSSFGWLSPLKKS
jgi:hypothetical protein